MLQYKCITDMVLANLISLFYFFWIFPSVLQLHISQIIINKEKDTSSQTTATHTTVNTLKLCKWSLVMVACLAPETCYFLQIVWRECLKLTRTICIIINISTSHVVFCLQSTLLPLSRNSRQLYQPHRWLTTQYYHWSKSYSKLRRFL